MSKMLPLEIQKRAFGRSLSDFRLPEADTPHNLLQAEEKLLDAAGKGVLCNLTELSPDLLATDPAQALPKHAASANKVRADFLRFLLLGGDAASPVHEKGIQLAGAFVEGDIDLAHAENVCSFALLGCSIKGRLVTDHAALRSVTLSASHIGGMICDGASIDGDVSLSQGFSSSGVVSFNDAEIEGHLSCSGATIKNRHGFALSCEGARVRGNVNLEDGFDAIGAVTFRAAEIAGSVSCAGGCFDIGSRPSPQKDGTSLDALVFADAFIKGALRFSSPQNIRKNAKIVGSLNLENAHVWSLMDQVDSWPKESAIIANVIRLDGFTYGRFAEGAPADATTRLRWLKRQAKEHLKGDLRLHPFEQLVSVLHVMGRKAEAREICYFKQKYALHNRFAQYSQKKRSLLGKLVTPLAWLWWKIILRSLLEVFSGSFRNVHIMTALVVMALAVSTAFYQKAAEQGLVVPRDPGILFDKELRKTCSPDCVEVEKACAAAALPPAVDPRKILVPRANYIGRRQTFWPNFNYLHYAVPSEACTRACKPAWTSSTCALTKAFPEYPAFFPLMFALDGILPPFVDLEQKGAWRVLESPHLKAWGAIQSLIVWLWLIAVALNTGSALKRR
jgi:hypothetical protein